MKQQDTLKLDKGQAWGMLSTLLLSLVLILPVMITACAAAAPEEAVQLKVVDPVVEEIPVMNEVGPVSDMPDLAENPELMIAGRYEGVTENKGEGGSAVYAANPELLTAARYAASITQDEAVSDSTFFAANPELKVVQHYDATLEK